MRLYLNISPRIVIPDGVGGLVVEYDEFGFNGGQVENYASVIRLDANGVPGTTAHAGLPFDAQETGQAPPPPQHGGVVVTPTGLLAVSGAHDPGESGSHLGSLVVLTSDGFPLPGSTYTRDQAITSFAASAEAGFIASLADGTVITSSGVADGMNMTYAHVMSDGAYIGLSGQSIVAVIGPVELAHPTAFSEASGAYGTNAASVDCGKGPDLNSLLAEYRGVSVKGIAKPVRPKCEDFVRDGAKTVHFDWDQLSGRVIPGGRPDNSHEWAIVADVLRTGLERIYTDSGGVRLTAAYRSPTLNAKHGGALKSGHLWGIAVDVKRTTWPGGVISLADWTALNTLSITDGSIWNEPYGSTKNHTNTHVHAAFAWWPGAPGSIPVPPELLP